MARHSRLCIHGPRPSGFTTLRPHLSALGSQLLHGHLGSPVLAGPTRNVTGEAMPTSFDVALTQLSFLEFVQRCNVLATPSQSTQSQCRSQTLMCRPPRHVEFLMTLPPRRRTSLVPRYLLTWLSRRLTAVRVPQSWMLPCRRHHTVLFPRTFLRSLALAQCPRFQLMRQCRLLHIVWCDLMLPHNLTSRSSSLAGFSQTVLWIVGTPFASPRQQCRAHMWYPCRRLDLINRLLHPRLRLSRSRSPMPAVLTALLCSRLQVPPTWNTPSSPCRCQEECKYRLRGNP